MNIKTEVRPADAEGIARAAELLRRGAIDCEVIER